MIEFPFFYSTVATYKVRQEAEMKSISGRKLTRVLEREGWVLLRIQGSHHIYGKTGSEVRLSVPIHGNKPLKTGLLHHLIKMAGISDKDLS